MEYPIIAPFYADIDTRKGGQVYWRASKQPEDIARAGNLVSKYYQGRFHPKEVVVITWDQVGYFKKMADKVQNHKGKRKSLKILFSDKHGPVGHLQ